MLNHTYVIRVSRLALYGAERVEGDSWYSYVTGIDFKSYVRRVSYDPNLDLAIKFSSWSEAAAVAAFIIHHVDEMYEDVLEVVKIDL